MKRLFVKPILIILCLVAFCSNAFAQKLPTYAEYMRGKVLVGNTYIDTNNATPQQMAHYRKQVRLNKLSAEHYYFNWLGKQNIGVRFEQGGKSKIYEGLEQHNNGQEFTSILIDGTTSVEIIAHNIDSEQKAGSYLYRVIKNNKQEIIGWRQPSSIKTSADGSVKYAYLGKFNYSPGEFLKVELYNIKNFSEQDAILIDWRPVEAAKADGYIDYLSRKPSPDNGYYSKGLTDTQHTVERFGKFIKEKYIAQQRPVQVKDFIETISANDIKFRADDSVQNLTFIIQNGERLYNYKVSLKREINGHTDSLNLGENNSRFNLYKEFWKSPGKYQITFTPKIYRPGGEPITLLRSLATNIKFTVLPALNKQRTISVKTLGYIVIILLTTGGFMFAMYRDSQKRKLKREAQNRQIATLQLQSVRAQLNPHFIFNALAGIQNLMNKNEVENANKYLSKFARLTRNILDEGNKELTTIEQEVSLLNDYLQMEQMRFGFEFDIEINEQEIDQQIEIPAMLLQPFAENAVKHGVSALKEKGSISIIITKTGSTLVLAVKDNGKGFAATNGTGMGLKLCEDRIALLNQVYKNTNILLHTVSNSNGTLITIELQNWL
jgi:two-component system LytT family sensor kinase